MKEIVQGEGPWDTATMKVKVRIFRKAYTAMSKEQARDVKLSYPEDGNWNRQLQKTPRKTTFSRQTTDSYSPKEKGKRQQP